MFSWHICASLLFSLFIVFPVLGQVPAGKASTHTVRIGEHNFTLPQGFTIENVAGTPGVDRPVTAAFDEEGRLYVADSSGNNARPVEQQKNPTHRIVRLESTKKDGIFDKSTVFAEKLPFMQGTMWLNGSLYVAAPPQILKLTDTNNDGIADKREVWHDGQTLTGCANDLHGPYLGPDGLIYWTKGAFAEQQLKLKNGSTFKTRASHVFRAKPDHSEIEVMMTGGMDNPVGLAFLPNGELFCSCTFLQHPAAGKRDGIIHCYPGAVYGKDHDPVHAHPRAQSTLTEPMTHLGPAAPAGMLAYRSAEFGPEFTGNLFCSQFNMAKVSRHILEPNGATYSTIDSDFVVSDNRDFHPTDVLEDRDGSLLIVDTGGWYKLCCPSSIVEKKEIMGAIYRVKKTGAHKNISKPIERVKLAAPSLDADSFLERRQAVEHLVRTRGENATVHLLDALTHCDDDVALFSSIVQGLIELGQADIVRDGLKHIHTRRQRGALIALDQMRGNPIQFADVDSHLTSHDAALEETAWWIASRHPAWGKNIVAHLRGNLLASGFVFRPNLLPARLAALATDEAVQEFLPALMWEWWLEPRDEGVRVALQAMAKSRLKSLPKSWAKALGTSLILADDAFPLVLEVLKAIPPSPEQFYAVEERLIRLNEQRPEKRNILQELQLRAVAPAQAIPLNAILFDVLRGRWKNDTPLVLSVLARARLTPEQLIALTKDLAPLGPLERATLLDCFTKTTDEKVGVALVAALNDPTLHTKLRRDQLQPILAKYPKSVQVSAEKLYTILDDQLKVQHTKLENMLKTTTPGDVRRGQVVFNSAKAACVACHTIGYVGGKIGPDLTRIGSIRGERDLLEAIVFPSASFVRSYEPVRIDTKDGRTFNGILKRDAPDEIVLIVSATEEARIERANIATQQLGTVSVMPAGLDQQLKPQELVDLVAFLKSLK